jgi:2-keto-3-deoxy-L-rhamnonate aldolase RhmA
MKDKPAHLLERNAGVSLSLMIESRAGLAAAHELAALDGVDYLSFGMMDLAQSLGHPGDPGHADVKQAMREAGERVRKAGKPIREDFMRFAWITDILTAGAKQLLGP